MEIAASSTNIGTATTVPGGHMNRVYNSLRVAVHDTLQRGKANFVPLVRGKGPLSLNDEMEELERILLDRLGRLKAAVKEGEAVVADETQHAEQLIASLRVNIAALEAKLRETEDTVRREESARQKMEETLTAKIHDLQNDIKKKEQVLESRGNEINDLKSKIDGQVKQVAELELAVQKAKVEVASQAEHAEHLTESFKAQIAALEAQLRDTEEVVRKQESAIKGLEQNLTDKIQDFESQARNKEELLAGRDAEINDLKSQLKLLTKGIGEMSSFFKQAEALATVEGQGVSTAVLNEPLNRAKEKPATFQSKGPKVTPIVPDAAREIVSPELFQRITDELTEVINVIRPIASVIVRDHVVALRESMKTFPKTRLPELLESLSKEVLDEKLKIDFRERFAQSA
jgi:chromosome segregation ATPase